MVVLSLTESKLLRNDLAQLSNYLLRLFLLFGSRNIQFGNETHSPKIGSEYFQPAGKSDRKR
jgi:hypothetical protein